MARPCTATQRARSYQAAIDEVVDKVERQAVDHRRSRVCGRARGGEADTSRRLADGTADARQRQRMVKVKRFAIEPMFEEDAVTQMEDLGHQFFVFVNAENERVAVLYRRNDGDYGIIEPIVAGGYTKRSKASAKH